MKPAELERYREILEAKRADVLARVRQARAAEHEGGEEDAPDLGDRALSTMSRDLNYQLTATERDILRRVEDALKRIQDGSFGACTSCGKQVQPGRLAAVPWARHCIACQELQDRGEL